MGRALCFCPRCSRFGDMACLKSASLGPLWASGSAGGQKAHFGAKKNGRRGRWKPYRRAVLQEEICGLSVRTLWRTFRRVLGCQARGMTIVLDFGTMVLKILAKTAKQGPFWGVFREFLRCEGPKSPKKVANRSLYLYGPCAFDRLRF